MDPKYYRSATRDRDEADADGMREKIRMLSKRFAMAEIAEAGIKDPIWVLVKEVVADRTKAFESAIYAIPAAEFASERDRVQSLRSFVAEIDGLSVGKAAIAGEIDRLRQCLEDATKKGRIADVEVP